MEKRRLKFLARQPWVVRVMVLALLPMISIAQIFPPAWVGKFPNQPDQYIGIGRVNKREHPGDYRELAQSAALAQISGEISIRVKTVNSSAMEENGDQSWETYSQHISTDSRNELSGYELVDTYETEGEFFALYALDKQNYLRKVEEKVNRFASDLKREVQELRTDLENRRFHDAMNRYTDLRGKHAAFIATHSLTDDRRASLDSLCDTAQATLREATRNPLEISLDLHADGSDVPDEAVRQIRNALFHFQSPFYRVTQKYREGDTLKIRLLGMNRDTLEGLTFTGLRGEVCWPGDPTPRSVRGKSGHSNRDRSFSLALRDFVKELESSWP